jgi:hypothetical protein
MAETAALLADAVFPDVPLRNGAVLSANQHSTDRVSQEI